jgi:hypothetical protein
MANENLSPEEAAMLRKMGITQRENRSSGLDEQLLNDVLSQLIPGGAIGGTVTKIAPALENFIKSHKVLKEAERAKRVAEELFQEMKKRGGDLFEKFGDDALREVAETRRAALEARKKLEGSRQARQRVREDK